MESFLLHGLLLDHQSLSSHKSHIGKNTRRFNPTFSIPNSSMGLLQTPPPFLAHSHSLRPPPLLPLPAANLRRSSSTPPANRSSKKPARNPNKSKSPKKRETKKNVPKKPSPGAVTVSLTDFSGPDPDELPKNVTAKVFRPGSTGSKTAFDRRVEIDFPGSVAFAISPPPSSLPLPSFSLRPKLSCNAQAAGVDSGATDNLRRILRLQ